MVGLIFIHSVSKPKRKAEPNFASSYLLCWKLWKTGWQIGPSCTPPVEQEKEPCADDRGPDDTNSMRNVCSDWHSCPLRHFCKSQCISPNFNGKGQLTIYYCVLLSLRVFTIQGSVPSQKATFSMVRWKNMNSMTPCLARTPIKAPTSKEAPQRIHTIISVFSWDHIMHQLLSTQYV